MLLSQAITLVFQERGGLREKLQPAVVIALALWPIKDQIAP